MQTWVNKLFKPIIFKIIPQLLIIMVLIALKTAIKLIIISIKPIPIIITYQHFIDTYNPQYQYQNNSPSHNNNYYHNYKFLIKNKNY
jgi:hypothetical protein